jgi:hypothetical protein
MKLVKESLNEGFNYTQKSDWAGIKHELIEYSRWEKVGGNKIKCRYGVNWTVTISPYDNESINVVVTSDYENNSVISQFTLNVREYSHDEIETAIFSELNNDPQFQD